MRVAQHAVVACLLIVIIMMATATADEGPHRSGPNGPALNDTCSLTAGDSAVQWAVGDSGRVFKTVNGTTQLEYNLGKGQYDLLGVSFADVDHGWIVGSKRDDPERGRGVVFRTTTGGENSQAWTASCPVVRPDINVPFLKVQAMDVRHVWITCEDGHMLYSNDGGARWAVTAKCNRPDTEWSDHEK